MYEFLLTIHVLAAVIWVGGGIAMHILGRRVLRRNDPEEIYKFSAEVNLVAAEGPTAPGVVENVRQALMVNSFEILILVLVVIDMTVKPGL